MSDYTPKQLATGCRYFNGIQHEQCKAGVRYSDIQYIDDGKRRLPCGQFTNYEQSFLNLVCDKRDFKSEVEIDRDEAEHNERLVGYIKRLDDFSNGESHTCPHCEKEITGAKLYAKIEPEVFSLYVLPCNCRLGLWTKAPDWIIDVEIVESEYAWDSSNEDEPVDVPPDLHEEMYMKGLFDE